MLKESRKIKLFIGLQYGTQKFNSATTAARTIGRNIGYGVYDRWMQRRREEALAKGNPMPQYDWRKREQLAQRAMERIKPTIMWAMQRKQPKD